MAIVSIILGILLVICGFSLLFTPLMTFLGIGTLLSIVLMIWGIMSIVKCVSSKKYDANFALAILAVILAFFLMISPATTFVTDVVILYIAAVFVILRGLVSVIMSVKSAKGSNNKWWIFGVILGILGIIVGIIFMVYPLLGAAVLGMLIAFFFIYAGFDVIFIGAAFGGGNGGAAA